MCVGGGWTILFWRCWWWLSCIALPNYLLNETKLDFGSERGMDNGIIWSKIKINGNPFLCHKQYNCLTQVNKLSYWCWITGTTNTSIIKKRLFNIRSCMLKWCMAFYVANWTLKNKKKKKGKKRKKVFIVHFEKNGQIRFLIPFSKEALFRWKFRKMVLRSVTMENKSFHVQLIIQIKLNTNMVFRTPNTSIDCFLTLDS